MTCAKRQVICSLVAESGDIVVGTNACANPQEKCPRDPGEGYEKCKTICKQAGHAEIQALEEAKKMNIDITGGMAIVRGIPWVCRECGHALEKAGLHEIRVIL